MIPSAWLSRNSVLLISTTIRRAPCPYTALSFRENFCASTSIALPISSRTGTSFTFLTLISNDMECFPPGRRFPQDSCSQSDRRAGPGGLPPLAQLPFLFEHVLDDAFPFSLIDIHKLDMMLEYLGDFPLKEREVNDFSGDAGEHLAGQVEG